MAFGNSLEQASERRPKHANDHHGQVVGPGETNNLLAVAVIGWIFAAVTLALTGTFTPVAFLVAGGFATCVVMISAGLSVLIATAVQKLRPAQVQSES